MFNHFQIPLYVADKTLRLIIHLIGLTKQNKAVADCNVYHISSSPKGVTIPFSSRSQGNGYLRLSENALVYHLFISTLSGRSKKGDIHEERQLKVRRRNLSMFS